MWTNIPIKNVLKIRTDVALQNFKLQIAHIFISEDILCFDVTKISFAIFRDFRDNIVGPCQVGLTYIAYSAQNRFHCSFADRW